MNLSELNRNDLREYDLTHPDERLYVGRKPKRRTPNYAVPFPEHLISKAPPEITDQEWEIKEDEYLRLRGIK
jgi:hypothetical protein